MFPQAISRACVLWDVREWEHTGTTRDFSSALGKVKMHHGQCLNLTTVSYILALGPINIRFQYPSLPLNVAGRHSDSTKLQWRNLQRDTRCSAHRTRTQVLWVIIIIIIIKYRVLLQLLPHNLWLNYLKMKDLFRTTWSSARNDDAVKSDSSLQYFHVTFLLSFELTRNLNGGATTYQPGTRFAQ